MKVREQKSWRPKRIRAWWRSLRHLPAETEQTNYDDVLELIRNTFQHRSLDAYEYDLGEDNGRGFAVGFEIENRGYLVNVLLLRSPLAIPIDVRLPIPVLSDKSGLLHKALMSLNQYQLLGWFYTQETNLQYRSVLWLKGNVLTDEQFEDHLCDAVATAFNSCGALEKYLQDDDPQIDSLRENIASSWRKFHANGLVRLGHTWIIPKGYLKDEAGFERWDASRSDFQNDVRELSVKEMFSVTAAEIGEFIGRVKAQSNSQDSWSTLPPEIVNALGIFVFAHRFGLRDVMNKIMDDSDLTELLLSGEFKTLLDHDKISEIL